MSLRIEIDKDHGHVFTCLDYVSGRVVLNIPSEETISSITLKLEGISRTRLEHPRVEGPGERPREKRRAEVELHRLLYVVQTVFPAEAVQAAREKTTSTSGFTLKAGEYRYPFRIRIPINSACTDGTPTGIAGGLLQRVSFDVSHRTVDIAKDSKRHVKGTLPPSLSGITDDAAWIKYFLKATVNRPAFYKTNIRQFDPFVFLPIEPPRPTPTNAESYARRKHEFIISPESATKKPGLFGSFRKPDPASLVPVRFTVEARFPSPAIMVPNERLPLRILLTKLDPFTEIVVMRSLQITLQSTTKISAHELMKDELAQWLILSVAGLNIPFGDANAPPNIPLEADATPWHDNFLPDTVPPTFATCNVRRSYQLSIEIGLSRLGDSQIDILPLLCPIQVYSGIRPPKQLVESAVIQPQPARTNSSLAVPKLSKEDGKGSFSANNSPLPSPTSLTSPGLSPRPHSISGASHNDGDDFVPPPTYEDAIADNIAPVDGPRREYQQEGGYYKPLDELEEAHH